MEALKLLIYMGFKAIMNKIELWQRAFSQVGFARLGLTEGLVDQFDSCQIALSFT